MKLKTKLLYMAAFLMLIVPLMLTGNASAVVYNPDGAVLNGTTGLWELPDLTAIEGCYDGTTTLNPAATRFACRNVDVPSLTTASTCGTAGTITSPAGWANAAARWSGCSNGGYTANSTTPGTDCVIDGGGTTNVFTRCNRGPANISAAECTSLPTYTFSASGTNCTTTGMTATQCAGYTAVSASGHNVVGSAAVASGVTTCSIYFADDTTGACTAAAGTMSTANTDETRGYCGGNWVFKAGTTGDWGSSVRNNCLKCHNPAYMDGAVQSPAGQVSKYINASHKNASRKIVPGSSLANVWISTDGTEHFGIPPYLPGLTGNFTFPQSDLDKVRRIDWVNGKIEDTTNAGPGWVGQRNLPSGVYTEWYWEFGYYGEDMERGVYNAAVGSNGKPSAKQQACFACHATNYEGSASVDATKEPAKSFPGIHWDGTTLYAPGSRPGVVNFIGAMTDRATNVKTTTTYGKWDQFGVVCARCHNAAGGSHTSGGTGASNPASPPAGQSVGTMVNAVCGQCHVRAGSSDYAVTAGTGVLTTRAQVGTGHPNYHETDFLNSPHARFTGTYGQINQTASYNSAFMTANNGCVGCHNPHGSVREPLIELTEGTSAAPAEGIENKCADCHTDKSLTNMKHPTTAGTPASEPDGCAFCHMPSGRHLFRITTDANYTMTQPTAFSPKPDGTFTEAVWVDLQSACGQCHGGGLGDTGQTHNGAPYMKRSHLAVYATGIHNTTNAAPTASFTSVISGLTLTLTDTSLDDAAFPTNAVTVLWGDGSSTTADAGTAIPHTYATAGTFTIVYKVKDAEGLVSNVMGTKATVSTNLTIAVDISPDLGTGAKVVLKKKGPYGWSTKAVDLNVTTDKTFTIKKLGIYRIKVVKNGYTFDCDAGTAGDQSYIDVTMGGSTTVTCTHTP